MTLNSLYVEIGKLLESHPHMADKEVMVSASGTDWVDLGAAGDAEIDVEVVKASIIQIDPDEYHGIDDITLLIAEE